jgi:hypothetical protein
MVTLLTGVDLRKNEQPGDTYNRQEGRRGEEAGEGGEETDAEAEAELLHVQEPRALFNADATEEEISELPESDYESSDAEDDPNDGDYVEEQDGDSDEEQESQQEEEEEEEEEHEQVDLAPKRSSLRPARRTATAVSKQQRQAAAKPVHAVATPGRRRLLSTKSTTQRKQIEDSLLGSDSDEHSDENDAHLQNRFQTPRNKRLVCASCT